VNVGIKLFYVNISTEEEQKKYQTQMKEADGYKKLFSRLELCKNNKEREEICIILGRFYK
jgi:dsDNA-binding SOS-regulon protein